MGEPSRLEAGTFGLEGRDQQTRLSESYLGGISSLPHLEQFLEEVGTSLLSDEAFQECCSGSQTPSGDFRTTKGIFERRSGLIYPATDDVGLAQIIENSDPATERPLFMGEPRFLCGDQLLALYAAQRIVRQTVAPSDQMLPVANKFVDEILGFHRYLGQIAAGVETNALVWKAEFGNEPTPVRAQLLRYVNDGFMFAGLPITISPLSKLYTAFRSPIRTDTWVVPKLPSLRFENQEGKPRELGATGLAMLVSKTFPGICPTMPSEDGVRPANTHDIAYLAAHIAAVRRAMSPDRTAERA